MKFTVLTALSLSALTLAAPVEQAVPVKVAAVASADAANGAQLPWPFGSKAQKPPSTFAIAKAAFIGARLGALSGTKYTGAKAFFGAKYGALKGVSRGLRRSRGGRRQGGYGGYGGPRPFGGGFGGLGGPRPGQYPGGRRPMGSGGYGKSGAGGLGGFGPSGYRRDQQAELQAPDMLISPDNFGQDQAPQWANYAPEAPEQPEGADAAENGEDASEAQPAPEQPLVQEQQEPFDMRAVDDQIIRMLNEVETSQDTVKPEAA